MPIVKLKEQLDTPSPGLLEQQRNQATKMPTLCSFVALLFTPKFEDVVKPAQDAAVLVLAD